MEVKKFFGLLAVAGLLFVCVPAQRVDASPLGNPGLAEALSRDGEAKMTTEVRWRHYYYHRHYGYRRHYYGYRHYRHYGYRYHWGPRFYGFF
jgi:hypothetical protein